MDIDISKIHTIAFDFDGIFTNNKVLVDKDGVEYVECSRADGLGFDLLRSFLKLKKLNINFFILSKETNSVVKSRAEKLKIPCYNAVNNKLEFIEEYFKKIIPKDINPYGGLIYLGNDLNDFLVMLKAKVSVAPSDAHYEIKKIASIVLSEKGGEHFVRKFIEILIKFNDMTKEEKIELISNC